jgi:aminoglycoside 3-N-acetyltransferase
VVLVSDDGTDDDASHPSPVDIVDEPVTPERITAALRALGVEAGDVLLVHSSLSAIGWVPGGAQGVVEGLRDAVEPDGTVVVPTHSPDLSAPSGWENPPVPESWYETVRETTPAYRPDATPTRAMGAIPECLRDYDDAVRSDHPHYSFAALGADAHELTATHRLDAGLGEPSPLGAVYDRGGSVLVLGCDPGRNTSLHLAEHRADWAKPTAEAGAPVLVDGEREWVTYEELDHDDGDFAACAAAFADERPDAVATGTVGAADATLYDQRALVDFGETWLGERRE